MARTTNREAPSRNDLGRAITDVPRAAPHHAASRSTTDAAPRSMRGSAPYAPRVETSEAALEPRSDAPSTQAGAPSAIRTAIRIAGRALLRLRATLLAAPGPHPDELPEYRRTRDRVQLDLLVRGLSK